MYAIIIIIVLILLYNKSTLSEFYDFGPGQHPFVCILGGTHGNEPAVVYALANLVTKFHETQPIKHGKLKIIPCVNEWGFLHNSRYTSLLGGDLNRCYPDCNPICNHIIKLITGTDLVVDFHEGWGYHLIQPASIDLTISPTDYSPVPKIARLTTKNINANDLKISFLTLMNESCTIPSTLTCYLQSIKKSYFLVETTDQNNIQTLSMRIKQINLIIFTVCHYYHLGHEQT